jgi:hypothetical protein
MSKATTKISGIENLSLQQLQDEIRRGGRFVQFTFCISLILHSFRGRSVVYFIRQDENQFAKSLPWTLVSVLFGWWGVPWGFVYTMESLTNNLAGGKDVTLSVMQLVQAQSGGPAFDFEPAKPALPKYIGRIN